MIPLVSRLRGLSVLLLALALGAGVFLYARPQPAPVQPPAPQKGVDAAVVKVAPGDPRWKRFALVVGLKQLAQHPTLKPSPQQAATLAENLTALQKDDEVNDFLFTRLLQVLTPEQIRYMADNVRRPKGACTCPCSTWDPLLVGATKLLERRSEGKAEKLELPTGPDEGPDLEEQLDAPETLILLQGITKIERLDALRLTPEQSAQLLPVLTTMAGTLEDIEKRMQAMERELTPEQAAFIATEGQAWFSDEETAASMNEKWEQWLSEAISAMQAAQA